MSRSKPKIKLGLGFFIALPFLIIVGIFEFIWDICKELSK